MANKKAKSQQGPAPCLNKELSIVAHIATSANGSLATSQNAIDIAVAYLNQEFAETCLSFRVCEYNTMPQPYLFAWSQSIDEPDALNIHYRADRINIYFVEEVVSTMDGLVDGYAHFPGGSDVVAIKTSGFFGPELVHQIGHFFGLYHTHETSMGLELADGSNCSTTGDLVCDTRADPFMIDITTGLPVYNVDLSCNVVPDAQDPAGSWYLPPNNNIMSLYPDVCGKKFTQEQINRMVDQYVSLRNNLW